MCQCFVIFPGKLMKMPINVSVVLLKEKMLGDTLLLGNYLSHIENK